MKNEHTTCYWERFHFHATLLDSYLSFFNLAENQYHQSIRKITSTGVQESLWEDANTIKHDCLRVVKCRKAELPNVLENAEKQK